MYQSGVRFIKERFEAAFQEDEKNSPRLRSYGLFCLRFFYILGRKFVQDRALDRAAALSFASILSLIPLGVLLFFLSERALDLEEKIAQLQELALSVVDETAKEDVRLWIEGFVKQLRRPLESSSGFTPLALFGLFLAAMGLFRSAERHFTSVWRAELTRGWFKRISTFWLLLTAIPFILALALLPELERFEKTLQGLEVGLVQSFLHTLAFPISISFFAFTLLFALLPNVSVKINAAAVGALVSAVIWVTGTLAFAYYLRNWANQGVYGALGALPFSLIWVYFSWLVALIGAEVSYCKQNFPILEHEVRYHISDQRVSRSVLGLLVMERLFQLFENAEPAPGSVELALQLQAPIHEVQAVVDRLRDSDFVTQDMLGHLSPRLAASRLTPAVLMQVFPLAAGFHLPPGMSESPTPVCLLIQNWRKEIDAEATQRSFAEVAQVYTNKTVNS